MLKNGRWPIFLVALMFAIDHAAIGTTFAYAASPESSNSLSGGMGLQDLIEAGVQNNPKVLSKKKAYEAKKAKVIDAWLLEDPKFGVDVEGQPSLFKFSQRSNIEYMAEQEIPFPSKLFLRGLAASKEAQIAYQEYKEEERQLIWRIEQPYHEIFLSTKTIKIMEESRQLLEQVIKSASARYETGQALQADTLRAQIEKSKVSIELFNAHERKRLAEANLSYRLGRTVLPLDKIDDSTAWEKVNVTLERLEELALKHRPELQAFVHRSEQAGVDRDLVRQDWLPDLTLRYEGRQFLNEGSIDEHDTFIGVRVPVWSLIKGIGGKWAAAEADAKAAQAALEDARNKLLLDVREAYSKLKQAENTLTVYEMSILPQSKQAVEVTMSAYEAGKADFIWVIDAHRAARDNQLNYYKALTDYRTALAELIACCGADFK